MKTKPIIVSVLAFLSVISIVASSEAAFDAKCFTECNKTHKACMASCGTNTTCVNGCIAAFRSCTASCNK